MSSPSIYMSRAFVEFGPFTLEEFHVFKDRGILKEADYFRKDGESTWLHVSEFAATHPLNEKPSKSSSRSATEGKTSARGRATTKKSTAQKK